VFRPPPSRIVASASCTNAARLALLPPLAVRGGGPSPDVCAIELGGQLLALTLDAHGEQSR